MDRSTTAAALADHRHKPPEQPQGRQRCGREQGCADQRWAVEGLGSGTVDLRKGNPVAVSGSGIHLNLGIGSGVGRKHERQTSLGIGATQLDRLTPGGGQQADGGVAGRLTAGEGAVELIGAGGVGMGMGVIGCPGWGQQVGLDRVGPGGLRTQRQSGDTQKRKRRAAHGGSRATENSSLGQPAFQGLSLLRPA